MKKKVKVRRLTEAESLARRIADHNAIMGADLGDSHSKVIVPKVVQSPHEDVQEETH